MAIRIQTNDLALRARTNLARTDRAAHGSIAKLSSGLRINRAADDAAGLGISENLKADIRSLGQASRNSNDAVSLSQVAEGAIGKMQDIVVRMRELAMQSANGTLGATERHYITQEFARLLDEIDRISDVSEFNGIKLLDGTASAGLQMQVGIHNTANDRLAMSVRRLTTSTIAERRYVLASNSILASTVGTTTIFYSTILWYSASRSLVHTGVGSAVHARNALGVFDVAIEELSTARAKLGAYQNRVSSTITNLSTSRENLSAANSRIRDVDVAEESAELTKVQILRQAGLSVLGQANSLGASALALLG